MLLPQRKRIILVASALLVILAAFIAVPLLSDSSSGQSPGTSGPPSNLPLAETDFSDGKTFLEVTVNYPDGSIWEHTVSCGAHGKDPTGECKQLGEFGVEGFTGKFLGESCTPVELEEDEIERATVTGTLAGTPVNYSFSRSSDCAIAEWDRLSRVFDINNPSSEDPDDYIWEPDPEEENYEEKLREYEEYMSGN